VHEDPSRALSDGATSLALADLPALLGALAVIDRARREAEA
jgi:3-deoxy-D-manno-octulosonic acid (KDO) 8-phosphate synthase